jgi:tRNA A-37 threonylcarbamoyl transferase component Bud32
MPSKPILEPERVIKFGPAEVLRIEAEKTRRAHAIGKGGGLFRVPRVLSFNPSRGELVLERLNGIQPFQKAFSFGPRYRSSARLLGKSLAAVHARLTLPSGMKIPLPAELDGPGKKVFLHGDLSVYNVCTGEKFPPVVILDWQMTKVHGGEATYGTPFFDLIWFINNLFYRPGLSHLNQNRVISVAEAFLEGYGDFNQAELSVYAEKFFHYKLPSRVKNSAWRERFLLPLSHRLTRTFISRLKG